MGGELGWPDPGRQQPGGLQKATRAPCVPDRAATGGEQRGTSASLTKTPRSGFRQVSPDPVTRSSELGLPHEMITHSDGGAVDVREPEAIPL